MALGNSARFPAARLRFRTYVHFRQADRILASGVASPNFFCIDGRDWGLGIHANLLCGGGIIGTVMRLIGVIALIGGRIGVIAPFPVVWV